MARRSKRAAGLSVGIVGSGSLSAKATKKHLSDFIEAQDSEISWVFGLSENSTKTEETIQNFLYDESAVYSIVSDGSYEDAELEGYATAVFEADAVPEAVIDTVAEADGNKVVIIILDEDSEDDLDLVERALANDITVLDLLSGLQKVELQKTDDDEDDGDGEDEADDDEEVEVAEAASLPENVQKLIDRGKTDDAIAKLKSLDRDELADLADTYGVVIEKGQHRKTIAANIVAAVSDSEEEPEDDEPAEDEEAAQERPARRSRKKQAEPEPDETEDEDGTDEEVADDEEDVEVETTEYVLHREDAVPEVYPTVPVAIDVAVNLTVDVKDARQVQRAVELIREVRRGH